MTILTNMSPRFLLIFFVATALFISCKSSGDDQKVLKAEVPSTEVANTEVKTQAQEATPAKPAANKSHPQESDLDKFKRSFTLAEMQTDIQNKFPFEVELMDADGEKFTSSEIFNNGKPTAILFWLSTCGPCKMKFAAMEKKYANWKEQEDFNMVAISVDWPKNVEKMRKMIKDKNWPWPVYHDINLDFKKIMPGRLNGLPQEFLFNADGELVYHKKKYYSGYEDKLFEQIQMLNAE